MSHYTVYYTDQVGGHVSRVYIGNPTQRGHGIGSFLGGLYRAVLPLFKSGVEAIGKETFRSGINILDDVANKNITIREALKNRGNETADNLKRKALEKIDKMMTGSGYKKRRITKKRQSVKKHSRKRIGVKRLKKSKQQKKKKTVKKRVNKRKNKSRTAYDIFNS